MTPDERRRIERLTSNELQHVRLSWEGKGERPLVDVSEQGLAFRLAPGDAVEPGQLCELVLRGLESELVVTLRVLHVRDGVAGGRLEFEA